MGIVVPFSILIPICMFIYRNKDANKSVKIIFYYLITAGLINAFAVGLARFGIQNLPVLHVYTLVEALFFLIYFNSIFKDTGIKKIIKILMVVFPLLCVINFTFIQSIFTFNTYTRPLEALIITTLCLTYFYKSGFSENWLGSPINWINVGILLYFPTASIIFILSNYFTFVDLNRFLVGAIWNIHACLVLGMYIVFTKAFSLIKRAIPTY